MTGRIVEVRALTDVEAEVRVAVAGEEPSERLFRVRLIDQELGLLDGMDEVQRFLGNDIETYVQVARAARAALAETTEGS